MDLHLPGRNISLLIILLSLLSPAQYAIGMFYPPVGKEFVGYPDDALMLTIMKSPLSNFDDPWSFDGGKVWHNPLIGSTYLFILLGIVPIILNINLYAAFVFFKFLFSLLFYITAYNFLLCFFDEQRARKAFIVFALVSGLGGIIYTAASLIFSGSEYIPAIGYALTREFDELAATAHSLTHIFRLYYMIPETAGMLSVISNFKGRKNTSGVFLFVSFLFYPMYGIAFSLVNFLLSLSRKYDTKITGIISSIKDSARIIVFAAPAALIWILPSLERPYYFTSSRLVYEARPMFDIFISLFFFFVFAAYFLVSQKLIPKKPTLGAGVILALFSIANLFPLTILSREFKGLAMATGLYGFLEFVHGFSLFIEIAAVVIAVIFVKIVLDSKMGSNEKFLFAWSATMLVLAGIDPAHILNIVNTLRFAPSLLMPLSVLAFLGIEKFSSKHNTKVTKVVLVLVMLSLPSLVGYNIWLYRSARMDYGAFVTHDEREAFSFLAAQEDGLVMADLYVAPFIPYYTGKHAVLFSGRRYSGLLNDVNAAHDVFYSSNATPSERKNIVDKYGIRYVILRNNSVSGVEGMALIRDGPTKIYKVQ